MSTEEFRCFVGGLSWGTTDQALENSFRQFGRILEAKVIVDRGSGRSRGFGFVTFADQRAMDDAIERLHNKELDGRVVTVNRAMPKTDTGGDRERDRDRDRDRDHDRYRDREYPSGYSNGYVGRAAHGDGGGSAGRDDSCFRCGRQGHWARDCHFPSSRGDRYGLSRPDREVGREHFGSSYSGGRYGDRGGGDYYDRYSNDDGYGRDRRYDGYRDREGGRASERLGGPVRYEGSYRERPGPYDRPAPFDRPAPYDRLRVRGGRSSYDRY